MENSRGVGLTSLGAALPAERGAKFRSTMGFHTGMLKMSHSHTWEKMTASTLNCDSHYIKNQKLATSDERRYNLNTDLILASCCWKYLGSYNPGKKYTSKYTESQC